MSTELQTKMASHTISRFWGGDDRGVCVQVTSSTLLKARDSIAEQLQDEGFIRLTMEEAAALCNDLGAFVKAEAIRRQGLLKEQLEQAKLEMKTVFHEGEELPADLMAGPELAVDMVSKFCPKSPRSAGL